ncbi:ninja-family protein AFP3-like [Impatiens glandulifera]|uniref:ninja-family protein AFP3-like n=1 Tax=Impatiens glandulifera TaxID=253017 RepID=UPI001FB15CE2|nr:ninja-family protein AFP3-like [Impatiens glandulifera]
MSKAAAVTPISSTGKAVVNFPASEELSGTESANINLTLSLGGLYGEIEKEKPSTDRAIDQMEGMKCTSLKRLSPFPPEAKKMLAGKWAWPDNWEEGSSSRTTAVCRAVDKLKSSSSQGNSLLLIKNRIEVETQTIMENSSRKIEVANNVNTTDVTAIKMMSFMPTVTTIGDKPNGRKIEGFLSIYNQQNIQIICVCHGRMMSPLEFVRHAGGTELKNPMRYINVLSPTL